MDTKTGDIYLGDELIEKLAGLESEELKAAKDRMVSLSQEEYKRFKPMPSQKRLKIMKAKSCECGSGKKFKNCCWPNQ